MSIKNLEVTGEVTARNASDKVLNRKSDNGTYHLHSFVVKVKSMKKNVEVEDEIAFKTVQSDVIQSFQVGNVVSVKFSLDARAWVDKETKEHVLKEDKYNGAELFTSFVDFYAYGVDVIDASTNKEDTVRGNTNFEQQSGITQPPEGEDDFPF